MISGQWSRKRASWNGISGRGVSQEWNRQKIGGSKSLDGRRPGAREILVLFFPFTVRFMRWRTHRNSRGILLHPFSFFLFFFLLAIIPQSSYLRSSAEAERTPLGAPVAVGGFGNSKKRVSLISLFEIYLIYLFPL